MPAWFGIPVLLIAIWLFISLKIEIAKSELRWRFEPGLIRKSVPPADIASARPVRSNLSEG